MRQQMTAGLHFHSAAIKLVFVTMPSFFSKIGLIARKHILEHLIVLRNKKVVL
jgi:hypothetical protein